MSTNEAYPKCLYTEAGYHVWQHQALFNHDFNQPEINQDVNPIIVKKRPKKKLEYVQEVTIRYLKPPTPPPPGDIIIEEIEREAYPPAPPLVIRQQPPRPHTPEPLIIRETPPRPPPPQPTQIIRVKRDLPPPPRKVIFERLPPLPPKPRPVLIERWLPYKKQKRRVVYKKTPLVDPPIKQKNLIVQWEPPEINIRQEVKYLGIIRADPQEYVKKYGPDTLKSSDNLPRYVQQIPTPKGLTLAADSLNDNLHELYGDIDALRLIDLDREGLGHYRQYINDSLYQSDSNSSSHRVAAPQSHSPVFNNLSDLIEKNFLSLGKDLNSKISIYDAERLFYVLNQQMGKNVTHSLLMDFFTLLEINWDGNVDLSEFKRAFISTI